MPTLTVLQDEVKREADLGDSVSSADLTAVINEECAALHELMVDLFQDYSVTSGQVTVTANTDSIALPAAVYKVRAVEDDANDDEPLPRFAWEDRKYVGELSYAVLGANLIVRPKQSANRTYNVWYAPQYTALSAGSDTFTVPNQWHTLAVLNAAARFCTILEKDASALTERAERVRQRIIASASQRDAGDPGKARDVHRRRRRLLNGIDFDREPF
jgi:hypothetical protein